MDVDLSKLPATDVPAVTGGDLPADCVIAIDGPAGSGKSTTARALASRFGLLYIDTGAMYRALTWAALRKGIPQSAPGDLCQLLQSADLELRWGKRDTVVIWNGQDISTAIRTSAVDQAVSLVSGHSDVRLLMVERQRNLGRRGGVVMEGRDIGTVVFPLATVKLYLDASLSARVGRRYRQYRSAGQEVTRDHIEAELTSRDKLDSERDASPLTISPDALVLDTSSWNLQEQHDRAAAAVRDLIIERQRTVAEALAPHDTLMKYQVAYTAFEALARFYSQEVIHLEGQAIPKGCIIASNHVSWWDPPLVGATIQRSRVRTLAKAELFRPPPLGSFFRFLDTIPIQRSGYDAPAFRTAIAALKAGDNIFIFPEGTRRPICKPGPVLSGLGILAQATGAPLQPLFVRGTCDLLPGGSSRSPLEVWVAPLVRMHALPVLRQMIDKKEITALVSKLCESIYWELQARSFARNPVTEWELAESASQERVYREKYERLFGARKQFRAPTNDDSGDH